MDERLSAAALTMAILEAVFNPNWKQKQMIERRGAEPSIVVPALARARHATTHVAGRKDRLGDKSLRMAAPMMPPLSPRQGQQKLNNWQSCGSLLAFYRRRHSSCDLSFPKGGRSS
jgi:hypothetical protein